MFSCVQTCRRRCKGRDRQLGDAQREKVVEEQMGMEREKVRQREGGAKWRLGVSCGVNLFKELEQLSAER